MYVTDLSVLYIADMSMCGWNVTLIYARDFHGKHPEKVLAAYAGGEFQAVALRTDEDAA